MSSAEKTLAILGGAPEIKSDQSQMFSWPIVTDQHKQAVLRVIEQGSMSGTEITERFERKYACEMGMKYSLASNNGTSALHSALFAIGVGHGDEVICPSLTYWASIAQVYSLGATPVFAEVDPETLCIDPEDITRRISSRTKAIVVVHYAGMPADMDAIMPIAHKHNLKVLEDGSHAHAALYKGKQVGTFGDASGFSLMSGKSFAIGEGGIMFTNDQAVYERAVLFGHYCKHDNLKLPEYKKYAGLPCGGYKYRMHQASSAFGLVQLSCYKRQFAEIEQAMTYFCDRIDEIPGLRTIRPAPGSHCTKGGWFLPLAHYDPEQFSGLSVKRFSEALNAEGSVTGAGCNIPLHTHSLFTEMDVYNQGKPTRIANLPEGIDIIRGNLALPITEQIPRRILALPWFKHNKPQLIDQHISVFNKVAENHKQLLPKDDKNSLTFGGYSITRSKNKAIV